MVMPPYKTTTTAIHSDTRKNIPTEELRDFVTGDEQNPSTVLYPRDTSLDPQLVWKGKDEQDAQDLSVPAVPIYIQEHIHPQAIVEDLARTPARAASQPQLSLFDDAFDYLDDDFGKRVEFYQHDTAWTNRMILGDSLLAMSSLAEKEGLKSKVQTIYIDPPYGISFGSNWQVSTRKREVRDNRVEDASRQPEQVKAFRDTWKLGIHSYLAYLRDRFVVARDLLTDSGSCFVQIGDENVHRVRSLMDEVFGDSNFVSQITVRTSAPLTSSGLAGIADYIVWYAKDKSMLKYRDLFQSRETGGGSLYTSVELKSGERRRMTKEERQGTEKLPSGSKIFTTADLASSGYTPSCIFPFEFNGKTYSPNSGKSWKTNRSGMDVLAKLGRIDDSGSTIRYVLYFDDYPVMKLTNLWTDTKGESDKIYAVQTPTKLIERCMLMTTDPGDLVLDPTCGSGTTAYVAEQWGRRWITTDTSRVALALARTRLMAARFPYYLLADSEEGIARVQALTGLTAPSYTTTQDIRKGFVYRRVPHVTLGSIANNPDIKPGMTRDQIDVAIARHADSETLYDQPYDDPKRIRVTGPFTVESLHPHRVLAVEDSDVDGTVSEEEAVRKTDFTTDILGHLKRAGVQNGYKDERLNFDRLEPFPGKWIAAEGEYTDAEGMVRRVAVSLGPEHGTVVATQVKEAAKEAVQGFGFHTLVVCGFAFDAAVSEEAKKFGALTVLPTRMNPDLTMGDDLLKKTGSGNLFMVFGEPDIDLTRDGDLITVKVLGIDVYDPTTGSIRTASTEDIACWFIDTDYSGDAFFVRHAYFTGNQDPYGRLKRALNTEIDESAWDSLYRTESRPFPIPATGRIAVKVINHYGDEVMKVYEV
jgi:adenine-specific DNA-methyltransferase